MINYFNKYITLCAIVCIFASNIFSQQVNRCSTTEYVLQLIEKNPALIDAYEKVEIDAGNYVNNTNNFKTSQSVVTVLPVVVHILYNNNAQNISDEQVLSQIEVLNEDFRRQNADATNTPTQFASIAADTEFEFCLAAIDPNGAPTTGITRRFTSVSTFDIDLEDIKDFNNGGQNAWPKDDYLNIWVGPISSGILGYATPPGGNPSIDGVVIDNQYFGKGANYNLTSPFNLGRTCTHEVGHWLGLSHVWGNGGNSCFNDDNITDTPNQEAPNYGCPNTTSSCGTTDMHMNYMDYVNDNCMNLFTDGQKERMTTILNTTRASLINSANTCEEFAIVTGNLPLEEHFENNGEFEQPGWSLQNPSNDEWSWAQTTVSADGLGTGSAFFDNYGANSDDYNNPGGTKDHLITPILNFNGSTIINFTFDLAYATYDPDFSDSLTIAYSKDLGQNWIYFYEKGGNSGLKTAPNNTSNFVPNVNEWRKESVNPASFTGIINEQQVIFRFTNHSDWGNNLYVDNIVIQTNVFPVGIEDEITFSAENEILVYPNPSLDGKVFVNISNYNNSKIESLKVLDVSGKIIQSKSLNNETIITLNLKEQATGIYFIELLDENNKTFTKKILID